MKKLIFILTCLLLVVPCQARIITVDDDGPADFSNIQAAINDADNGDTIIVAAGMYTGQGNRDIYFKGLAITVRSTDPNDPRVVGATVIDCQGGLGQFHSGFFFDSSEDSNTVLEGLTITGGFAVNLSGGISCVNESSPTIRNCIIRGNVGYLGGGIVCSGSSPAVNNCVIKDNDSLGDGGGLGCFYGSDPQITNCTIIGNSAFALGDGIYCFDSSPTITNCILWGDTTDEIYVYSGTPVVTYSDVQGGWLGTGNIDADPCFADSTNGDYHLKSKAGRWDEISESWIQDDVTSPCIDAGDPNSDWTAELWPHGKRINMGAYGGTSQASMSPLTSLGYIADLNNDDKVGFGDLKLFTNQWQNEQLLLSEDLDRNGFVDFTDFAIFGQQWSYPSFLEPGISYQVEDCNMEGGENQQSAADSNDTRFSVWVEGSYIHFEDLITANCCLDEIELQMTVEDGLITIYEIEHLTTPCFCLCDYPTTATLGPFEDGNYLVEVIDVNGTSLGFVEVTIGQSSEPGIVYQIENCNLGASGVFITEPPDPTRFTVTVEDLYIHFEDMMAANCCPDELELEMTVEDNLITIYEIEYTSEGCRCMCSFPITATLGPFEPGTYTLEVYETTGGFIGSTTITIGPVE
jgi:hypothetical protein